MNHVTLEATASSVPAPGVLDADGRIAIDLPCYQCRYNLRMQPIDGLCPECGAANRGNFDFYLAFASRRTLRVVTAGVWLLLAATALTSVTLLREYMGAVIGDDPGLDLLIATGSILLLGGGGLALCISRGVRAGFGPIVLAMCGAPVADFMRMLSERRDEWTNPAAGVGWLLGVVLMCVGAYLLARIRRPFLAGAAAAGLGMGLVLCASVMLTEFWYYEPAGRTIIAFLALAFAYLVGALLTTARLVAGRVVSTLRWVVRIVASALLIVLAAFAFEFSIALYDDCFGSSAVLAFWRVSDVVLASGAVVLVVMFALRIAAARNRGTGTSSAATELAATGDAIGVRQPDATSAARRDATGVRQPDATSAAQLGTAGEQQLGTAGARLRGKTGSAFFWMFAGCVAFAMLAAGVYRAYVLSRGSLDWDRLYSLDSATGALLTWLGIVGILGVLPATLLLHANHVLKRRPALRLVRFGTLLFVAFVLTNVLGLATVITLRFFTFYVNDVTSVPTWLVLLNLAQWVLVLAVPTLLVGASVYWALAYVAMQSVLQGAQRVAGLRAT